MRVLRLTPHFYWPQLAERGWPVKFDAIGGMQSQIYRLSMALSDLGVEQRVVTLRIPGAPTEWHVDDRLVVHGVRIPVFPMRSRVRGMVDLNVAWALGVAAFAIRNREEFDIVHVHCSGVMWPLAVGWAFAVATGKPLVLSIHCSVVATYHPMCAMDYIAQPIARWFEQAAIRRSSRTILLTPRVAGKILELVPDAAPKLRTVPDAIDADEFERYSTEAPKAWVRRSLGSDRFVLGYVGRIAREKGWWHLVELATLLRHEPFHVVVCGDGNEADLLRREVTRAGLDAMFTFTGYLPQEQVAALLGEMDALLLLSEHEEFGSVILEGLAMGVPVVAFATGGIPAVVHHEETAILVDPTVDSMAAALRRLRADPALCRRLAERGRTWVRERYGLTAAAEATRRVYDEACAPQVPSFSMSTQLPG